MADGVLSGKRIGVIGAGAMGSALCNGLVKSGAAPASALLVSDAHGAHLERIHAALGVRTTADNAQVAEQSDIVVLAVKPNTVPVALADIRDAVRADQLLISIAAGVRIRAIEAEIPVPVAVVRAMPNTAAQVNAGACAFARGAHASDMHLEWVAAIFRSVGSAIQLDERLMDAVTALSGSGPAYIYLVIEALIDGGVKVGLPREMAHQLAAQTVLGAAKMVIETGRHPAELKDMVATPAGTTITALAALEHAGLRAALIDAVERAAQRSAELGQ